MTDTKSSIDTFFDSYTAAFNRLDMAAIEQHYAFPALLVHKNGQVAYEKPAMIRKKLQEVTRYYRDLRFTFCRYETMGQLSVADERLVCVALKWIVTRDAPLPELYFHTTYHIRRLSPPSPLDWAIVTVSSFDEVGLVGT